MTDKRKSELISLMLNKIKGVSLYEHERYDKDIDFEEYVIIENLLIKYEFVEVKTEPHTNSTLNGVAGILINAKGIEYKNNLKQIKRIITDYKPFTYYQKTYIILFILFGCLGIYKTLFPSVSKFDFLELKRDFRELNQDFGILNLKFEKKNKNTLKPLTKPEYDTLQPKNYR